MASGSAVEYSVKVMEIVVVVNVQVGSLYSLKDPEGEAPSMTRKFAHMGPIVTDILGDKPLEQA